MLGRVVLGGLLEALDGSVAFLVQLLEVGFSVADAVVEVAHERVAEAVDPGGLDMFIAAMTMDIQDRPASHHTSLNGTPILPARYESEHDRDQNIREAGIQRPHDASASRELLLFVIARSGPVDLASKSVERPLERGGIFATLSQSASVLARS